MTLVDSAETAEYHSRIQRIQSLDEFSPEAVRARVLEGTAKFYTGKTGLVPTFSSLNDVLNKKRRGRCPD